LISKKPVLANLVNIAVFLVNHKQLLDEAEQNIVICQWRADQLFADAEGRGK